MTEVSIQDEIDHIQMCKPHVVILGAGASCAAFPKGDRRSRQLPLMDNIIKVLDLDNLLAGSNIEFQSDNFEVVYDRLYRDRRFNILRDQLEARVYHYFRQLEIPRVPTMYDYLLLSLRSKDVVATFNWDPFLVQAYRRNAQQFPMPLLLFLHGNVEVGCCLADKVVGSNGAKCPRCDIPMLPTKLLYPVADKPYHSDPFLSSQWRQIKDHLKKES